MGLNFMDINPIPHLTSPLKGEEKDRLALMRLRGDDELICVSLVLMRPFLYYTGLLRNLEKRRLSPPFVVSRMVAWIQQCGIIRKRPSAANSTKLGGQS
jgi:hypothetical protein